MNDAVEKWVADLPAPCTWERVRPGFWYVRIPGSQRRWIPIELELGERTLKATSQVLIPPEENEAEFYRFLLKHNLAAPGISFAVDGKGVICLVGRIPVSGLTPAALDALVGRIVETTETTFHSMLRIGFASRFRG